MKLHRLLLPTGLLILLWAVLAVYVSNTLPQLPERVATHFGAGGQADGWMSRSAHARLTLTAAGCLPLMVIVLFTAIRSLGGMGLNIPNRDYWLAPERRQETLDFFQRQGFWLAVMVVVFFMGLHRLVLIANVQAPPHLPGGPLAWMIALSLIAVVVWTVQLLRRFTRPVR